MPEIVDYIGFLEQCLKYCFLGVIQGMTEFIPISSTAHLKVVPVLLGWGDPGLAQVAVIQLGSIFAVCFYFWKDLSRVFSGMFLAIRKGQWREPETKLGVAIAIGTFPILLVGLVIKFLWPGYESSWFRSFTSIGLVSILMALFLAFAERVGKRFKTLRMVRGRDGFLIGCSQVVALIPGVSRSGITLTASLFDGWTRSDAAKFSFLLGIPAISFAGLVQLKEAFSDFSLEASVPLILGILSSAVVSWFSIDWLLKYLQKNNAWIFVMYRLTFGFILLAIEPTLSSN